VRISRERPDSTAAVQLIAELESLLDPLYPRESRHGLSVARMIAEDVAFFVVRVGGVAAGCGGLKRAGNDYGEVKRMYVRPQFRGVGIGRLLLRRLAEYAREQQLPLLRLETGIHQHEAIRLYEGVGFRRIPPFGPYLADPLSLCFELAIE